jgi:hypothetical protein
VHYRRLVTGASSSQAKADGHASLVLRWVAWGLTLGLIGGGLCGFSQVRGKRAGRLEQEEIAWARLHVEALTCGLRLRLSASSDPYCTSRTCVRAPGQDGGLIPINKNLWSPTFVLCMSSIAFLALALFYVTVDLLRVWSGSPFVYPGMNSITVYVLSELIA